MQRDENKYSSSTLTSNESESQTNRFENSWIATCRDLRDGTISFSKQDRSNFDAASGLTLPIVLSNTETAAMAADTGVESQQDHSAHSYHCAVLFSLPRE